MTTLDRRTLLRTASIGAGLGLIPASIRRAMALPASSVTGTIRDVEHVVILMQENRSFDHYFGTLPGVRGFGDRFTIPQPGGASVWQQHNGQRTVLPYYLDSTLGNALGAGTPHSWDDSHDAWDHGRMTHWPVAKTDVAMGYLKPADLDFHVALANAFTLCDHYHCALHGGTNSNRIYHWTGANHGPQASSDGARVAVINNDGWDTCIGTPQEHSLTWTTYPERLEAAGVRWKIYQQLPDNYTDNPLSGFKRYRECYARVNAGNLGSYSDISAGLAVPHRPTMDVPGSPDYEPLYKGIGNTEPVYGDYLTNFRADALADRLPAVSWIVGPKMYTEHPDATPAQGAYFIQQILDALTANPTVWGKTVFFINYDENDGYFDHLPPPNPPSTLGGGAFAGKSTAETSLDYLKMPVAAGSGEHASDGKPFGPGPRVPMFVVSPFSRGGFVNSQVFDHTSVLQFLEARFGVIETNITPWRRAVFGNLMSAFDFANPNAETQSLATALPRQNLATAQLQYLQQTTAGEVPVPAEDAQIAPVQPTGTRPARPLPYALGVTSRIDAGSGSVHLSFASAGAAGAVFHVYNRLDTAAIPRRYTVESGQQLADAWEASGSEREYDLWVLGPNGFHRLFRGSVATTGLEVTVRLDAVSRKLLLTLVNRSAAAVPFTVTAGAYRADGPWDHAMAAQSQRELAWGLTDAEGWYDFTVRAPGGFTRRVAGHLETGLPSISDPAMGAANVAAPIVFADRLAVPLARAVESEPIALGGFPGYLPIRVSPEAEVSIDGGRYLGSAPNVCAGQTVRLRHTSASTLNTPTWSTLTVGNQQATFKSVTAAVLTPDPTPPEVPGAGELTDASRGRFGGGGLGSLTLAGLAAAALGQRLRGGDASGTTPGGSPDG